PGEEGALCGCAAAAARPRRPLFSTWPVASAPVRSRPRLRQRSRLGCPAANSGASRGGGSGAGSSGEKDGDRLEHLVGRLSEDPVQVESLAIPGDREEPDAVVLELDAADPA